MALVGDLGSPGKELPCFHVVPTIRSKKLHDYLHGIGPRQTIPVASPEANSMLQFVSPKPESFQGLWFPCLRPRRMLVIALYRVSLYSCYTTTPERQNHNIGYNNNPAIAVGPSCIFLADRLHILAVLTRGWTQRHKHRKTRRFGARAVRWRLREFLRAMDTSGMILRIPTVSSRTS